MTTGISLQQASWPIGGGKMGALIRKHDWASTALGPLEAWPKALRAVVELVLNSPLLSSVVCGPDRILLYNDAAAERYGAQSETALGRPLAEAFPESYLDVAPFYDRVFAGESLHVPAQPLDLRGEEHADVFDAYLTPVRGESGSVEYAYMNGFEISKRLAVEAERDRQAVMLRESEERYRTLFQSLDEGFVLLQLTSGGSERPIDFRYIEINRAFEQQTGISREQALQRTVRELVPTLEPFWFDMYRSVALTGEARRFVDYATLANRFFQVYAFRVGRPEQQLVGALFNDITGYKRAETMLRESEERQVFLLKLNDALATLTGNDEIETVATRLLAEQLNVARAYYAVFREAAGSWTIRQDYFSAGLFTLAGLYRDDDFSSLTRRMKGGEAIIISDIGCDRDCSEADRAKVNSLAIVSLLGVPALKDGALASVLVVGDTAPRAWTANELILAKDVAERTRQALERARTATALRESEQRFRLFVENVHEYALVQTDFDGIIRSWNPGAERLFGYGSDEIIGQPFVRLLPSEDKHEGLIAREMELLAVGGRNEDSHTVRRKDGSTFWAQWITEPVRDDAGKLLGTAKMMRDETEREGAQAFMRNSLAEKEELLKEVHHRVKNNLQVITSLFSLQARRIDDKKTLAQFEDARGRVQSIASIHELLYQSTSFAFIDLGAYAARLASDVVRFYGSETRIKVNVQADSSSLEMQRAVPFALLLNELVSNICKHAFPDGQRGRLDIAVQAEHNVLSVVVSDSGVGLPPDFDVQTSSSLGVDLIRRLAKQLGATVQFRTDGGTVVHVQFPVSVLAEKEAV